MRIASGVFAIVFGVAMIVQPRRMSRLARAFPSPQRWLPFLGRGSNAEYDPDDDPYWFLPFILGGAFFVFIGIAMVFFSNR
jgi:hypothetical protein